MSARLPGAVRDDLRRKLAFLGCGAFGFALYCAVSLLLIQVGGVDAGIAAFVAVLVAVPPTFLLQKRVAFRDHGALLPAFAKYCALQLFNAVAIGLLAALAQRLGLPDAASVVASGLFVVVVSWLVLSGNVFRNPESGARPP